LVISVAGVVVPAPGPAMAGSAQIDALDSSVLAVAADAGRLDLFTVGLDAALHHRSFADGQWSGWEDLGGTLASAPTVVPWTLAGKRRLDVFARGSDNSLQHQWFDGAWSGWESLGGTLTSAPGVASWAAGRLDVFARGANNDLQHKWFDGGWSGWEGLGGALTSAPAVMSWGPGQLDILTRGVDETLQHKFFSGGWSGWENLGGTLTSAPTMASWGPGQLDVFARGTNSTLQHKRWAGGWSAWETLAGTVTSAPAVASRGTGQLDVFSLNTANDVQQESFANSTWSTPTRVFGLAPPVATTVPSRTSVYQTSPGGAAFGTIEYAYVDSVGKLIHGRQRDPGDFASVQYTSIGGNEAFVGQPGLTEQADGRVHVLGHTTNGDVWVRNQTEKGSPGWGGWTDMGGWVTSTASTGTLPDGRLVVFAVDADGQLWQRQQITVNGPYGAWGSLGTVNLTDAPTVVANRTGLQLFALTTTGTLRTASYTGSGTVSSWSSLSAAGMTAIPAVVLHPGFRARVFVRTADGRIATKLQNADGTWPTALPVIGAFISAGSPVAILDPVLGRTAVVARGTDNEIYRVWETAPVSGTWGQWTKAISTPDPAAVDPNLAPVTNANGQTWYVVFRNANGAIRVYERALLGGAGAAGAGSGGNQSSGASPEPSFTAATLPPPPAQ
jgi:hypothetical protein